MVTANFGNLDNRDNPQEATLVTMGRIRITLPTGTGVIFGWHLAFTRLSELSRLSVTGFRALLAPSASPRVGANTPL